ncbi:MAG: hypothetical protein H0T46_23590 [Deltaproteobacteria bacterium]|nr:hypothetical protein [Deltaproteobacteria bacterium]
MKTVLAALVLSTLSASAFADPTPQQTDNESAAPCDSCLPPQPLAATAPQPRLVATAAPLASAPAPMPAIDQVHDESWGKPAGARFSHGFRVGWTYIQNYEARTRENGMSLKEEFGLKTPHMMLLGYEGFYRIIGHTWLNVLMVGNVTIAGLEQSKFIPAASGLIGMEFNKSFQVGVGVNLTPDPDGVSHMMRPSAGRRASDRSTRRSTSSTCRMPMATAAWAPPSA